VAWSQNYTPLGTPVLSAAAAALPIATLFALLVWARMRAHTAALCGLLVAGCVAVGVFGLPLRLAVGAAFYGAAFGLFPVGWIVVNAIFLFDLSVEAGGFGVLRRRIARFSDDRRIQVLLIAFGFGAFVEGAAGFGAPVAITGALMVGLGFSGADAAKFALIGNTAPVAFGSLGIPLITLAQVTGLDLASLSATAGKQLAFFSALIPFWLVAVLDGRRGLRETWPACLVVGATFAVVQYLVSTFHGPWLVDLASASASIAALLVLLRFWQPQRLTPVEISANELAGPRARRAAWLPWALLLAAVSLWSVPSVKSALDGLSSPRIAVPALHLGVLRMPPFAPRPTAEPALFQGNLLSATGTALLCAALSTAVALGIGPKRVAGLYGRTLWRLRFSLATIAGMLALGFTTRYAGADASIGLALASTGVAFPFFSPLIGWLGSALTGSDTSSNVLFGNVQRAAALRLGISPIVTAAANSTGGVMGKMIDAQSIVVASAAAREGPEEKELETGFILRSVFPHSLALAILMGFFVLLEVYL